LHFSHETVLLLFEEQRKDVDFDHPKFSTPFLFRRALSQRARHGARFPVNIAFECHFIFLMGKDAFGFLHDACSLLHA
jgi:hypothetical protein